MHVRPRAMAVTAALTMALSVATAEPALARPDGAPPDDEVAYDLDTAVAETLEANPGSTRTGESTILLAPGVMVALPAGAGADAGTSALQASPNQCPRGWLCAWPDSDFRGPMLAVRDGVYIDYRSWWWDTKTGAILDCRGGCTGVDWYWDLYMRNYNNNITSIYNNTHTMTWAPFWSPRNNMNYYARNGAPSGYVGSKWNDSFMAACAC